MHIETRIALLSAFFFMLSGCAWIHGARVRKHERRVAAFEKARPDQAALQRGELKHAHKILRNMSDWRSYIDLRAKGLTRQEKEALTTRIDRARQRFLLRAASFAGTANLAYYLAKKAQSRQLPAEETLPYVRRYAKARSVYRQSLFKNTGTYRHRFESEYVWKTVHASYRATGNRHRASISRRRVRRTPNCVFSSVPFGREGVRNSGLSYYFTGSRRIYCRCYANRSAGFFRGYRGGFVVRIPVGIAGRHVKKVATKSMYARNRNYVDFVLDRRDLGIITRGSRAQLDVRVTLTFVGFNDNKIVWVNGRRRIRPDWKTFALGSSSFLWERR